MGNQASSELDVSLAYTTTQRTSIFDYCYGPRTTVATVTKYDQVKRIKKHAVLNVSSVDSDGSLLEIQRNNRRRSREDRNQHKHKKQTETEESDKYFLGDCFFASA